MNAAQIAVDEINEAGGINGYQVEFKAEDDQSDAEKSVNAYNSLKDWGMQVLMGTVTTTPCIAVADKTAEDGMFEITPSASSTDVIENDNVFQACFTDPSEDVMKRDIADCLGDNPFIECFVFENNTGVIMGYSMVAHSYSTECGGNCVWVEDIYIKPDYRGKNIAGKFFEHLDNMYGKEAVRFRLEVEEENERAVKAYKKAGFERLGYVQMAKDY